MQFFQAIKLDLINVRAAQYTVPPADGAAIVVVLQFCYARWHAHAAAGNLVVSVYITFIFTNKSSWWHLIRQCYLCKLNVAVCIRPCACNGHNLERAANMSLSLWILFFRWSAKLKFSLMSATGTGSASPASIAFVVVDHTRICISTCTDTRA